MSVRAGIKNEEAIKHFAKRIKFSKGDAIFQYGEDRDYAYIIEKGKINITDTNNKSILATLDEGEIFGEIALIEDGQRTAGAIADTDCILYAISQSTIREKMNNVDPIISLIITMLVERYRMTRINLPETIKQDNSAEIINILRQREKDLNTGSPVHDILTRQSMALDELKVEEELRDAIKKDQFVPYFQPIVNLETDGIEGFETLIRWVHPEKGIIFPDDFIPTAERTGVIIDLDLFMLKKACEYLPSFNEQAGKKLFFSINLSGIHFENNQLVDNIENIIDVIGDDAKYIRAEITESALIESDMALEILNNLKKLDLSIALDDFGTGYSSLGYLHKFPIDILKIDRSFVSRISEDEKGLDIVRAIANLAHDFKLKTVAEGIETKEDEAIIKSLGCEYGQGYYYSRPVPYEEALDMLKKD